jgi:hypothetical protein
MPVPKGKLRRPNTGGTKTVSVSFDRDQKTWLFEYCQANNMTFAYGIYEAIEALQDALDPELAQLDVAARKARLQERRKAREAQQLNQSADPVEL